MQKSKNIFFVSVLVFLLTGLSIEIAFAKNTKRVDEKTTVLLDERKSKIDLKTDLNTVDISGLQKIKGIGKKKADAIIDYRNKNGNFKSLEDLLKVKSRGINKNWLNKVAQFLTI